MSRQSLYLGRSNRIESDAARIRLDMANFLGDPFLLTTVAAVNVSRYPRFGNEGTK